MNTNISTSFENRIQMNTNISTSFEKQINTDNTNTSTSFNFAENKILESESDLSSQ